jgi:hypothetical protein
LDRQGAIGQQGIHINLIHLITVQGEDQLESGIRLRADLPDRRSRHLVTSRPQHQQVGCTGLSRSAGTPSVTDTLGCATKCTAAGGWILTSLLTGVGSGRCGATTLSTAMMIRRNSIGSSNRIETRIDSVSRLGRQVRWEITPGNGPSRPDQSRLGACH